MKKEAAQFCQENQCRVLTYLLPSTFSSQAAVTVMIVICIPGVFSYIRGQRTIPVLKELCLCFRSVWQRPSGSVQEVHCLALLGTFWGWPALSETFKGICLPQPPKGKWQETESRWLGKVTECEGINQLQKLPFAMDNSDCHMQNQNENLIRLYE